MFSVRIWIYKYDVEEFQVPEIYFKIQCSISPSINKYFEVLLPFRIWSKKHGYLKLKKKKKSSPFPFWYLPLLWGRDRSTLKTLFECGQSRISLSIHSHTQAYTQSKFRLSKAQPITGYWIFTHVFHMRFQDKEGTHKNTRVNMHDLPLTRTAV